MYVDRFRGGSGGAGGSGGDAPDCSWVEGETEVGYLAVEADPRLIDLAFDVNGCEVGARPFPGDGVNCVQDMPYYVPIPAGSASVVVKSAQGLQWKSHWEVVEQGCLEYLIETRDTTSMIMAFAEGKGAEGPRFEFPVDVYVDGLRAGALRGMVDDEWVNGLASLETSDAILELIRAGEAGPIFTLVMNDAPHVVEYSQEGVGDFRAEIPEMMEGWVSLGIGR